ncbi:unnamed protein product, partial [marine sediment metagenome]
PFVLVLIVVFSAVYYRLKVGIEEGSLREIRQQSVRNQANAHVAGLDLSSELNFPMIMKKIKKGDEIKDSSIALVHDWSDLLKGERQLFPIETEEIVYCVPGYYLEFKAKDKKIPMADYIEYQRTKTVDEIGARNVIGNGNVYINEYIVGYTTDETAFEGGMEELREEYAIDTNYEYVTVSVFMKKGYWKRWISSVFGASTGVIGGTVLGVVLVPFTGGGSLLVSGVALGGGITGGVIGYKTGS